MERDYRYYKELRLPWWKKTLEDFGDSKIYVWQGVLLAVLGWAFFIGLLLIVKQ